MSFKSIKRKKVFVAVLVLASIGVMAMLQYHVVSNLQSLVALPVLVSDIKSDMLTLRRNEKDFLARKDLLYRQKFLDNYDLMQRNLQILTLELQENDIKDTKTNQLAENLDSYKEKFLALVELQKKIGFNHQDGLYVSLRNAIHQVEVLLQVQQKYQLNKDMLMLRRHEKDFMLRNDLIYVEKFDKDMAVMQAGLSHAYLEPSVKGRITTALVAYENDFKALVSAVQQIGLSSNDGLHGEMRKSIHQVEDTLHELHRETLLLVDNAGSSTIMQILAFSVALILFIVAFIR
ncbi:MAG: hypothetical protein GY726_14215 [Proteobacteria bacterium]|nr:hypothetical protein [Pseudomonadota bacterium]MCP4288447.1 hypothetical protein [Gammaproteobacteria bacterium]